MNWQRARTDEKKNERKEAIYQAALTLFKKNGYDKVSFNAIASEAKFTKSNMYRYFYSKEEIFLNVFAELFQKWQKDLIKCLQVLKPDTREEHVAMIWVTTFLKYPHFLDLVPILFVSLEKNSSYEQLVHFKRLSKFLLYEVAIEISRIYPEIQGEDAFKFLSMSYAATSNYWAANSQNEALKKLYQQEEFKELRPNFEKDLASAVEIILKGLKSR